MQMKTNKLISVSKTIALIILILGIIHDVGTFTPLIKSGLACLKPSDYKAMIFMSLICGSSFILSGIILIMLLNKVEQFVFLIWPIIVVSIFLAISGLLSVVYMTDNPFAWIGLILNMSMFVVTINLKVKLDKK